MKTINIEIKPFTVPNFVIQAMPTGLRQGGFKPAPSYPLTEVAAETLSDMCDEFRAAVFATGCKTDPAIKH